MQHVKSPRFPYRGIIYGYEGVKDAFETVGAHRMRAKTNVEITDGDANASLSMKFFIRSTKAEISAKLPNDQ